jgi:hypothetical protein
MRGFEWENMEVRDELHSILIVKSRYGICNHILEAWDMQDTHITFMLHEVVDGNDEEAVVWIGGFEGVPNIHGVSVVGVDDGARVMWDTSVDNGTSNCKGLVIEDWRGLVSGGNGTLES